MHWIDTQPVIFVLKQNIYNTFNEIYENVLVVVTCPQKMVSYKNVLYT